MSGTVPPTATVPAPFGTVREWLRREWPLAAFCVGIAVVALFYNVFTSPDVLIDGVTYTSAAQKVAQGWHLTLDDTHASRPLFVHPPLMFLVQAAWLKLTGTASAALPSAIRTARLLAATAGVADVLLVASLAYRLTGRATARRRRGLVAVVALITALDPVLVRYDRQDVIEPFALCVGLLTLHAAWWLRGRSALAYVSVTGLLGGLALLTNEIDIFLIVTPFVFALLERDGPLIRRSAAALGIAVAFLGLFLLWAVELGLAGSFVTIQTATLQRLVGLVQITGLNVPGVSLVGSLTREVAAYSSSYIVLALGLVALAWCWGRRNNPAGNYLTAWLTASYAFAAYIVAVGTLNEQFFVYVLPAGIVGGVLFADAVIAGWSRRLTRRWGRAARDRRTRWRQRVPLVPSLVGATGCALLVALSAGIWVTDYGSPGDGVTLADRYIAARLPACAAVNASGDTQKYSYLLGGRPFASFSVGPAALADGVHYFLLGPTDAVEHSGDMSPSLARWIRGHGRRLVTFPSQVYDTVQLWYVPAGRYDPTADLVDISGGAYVNTVGSHCGGYTVTNGRDGAFYSAYQRLGGKGVLGVPLSRVAASGSGHRQLFTGAVLAETSTAGSGVRALPTVALLAADAPAAYRNAGLPAVGGAVPTTGRSRWLTDAAITRAYLGGARRGAVAYAAAVRRYGEPLGPPAALPGGGTGQAFADVVLEKPADGGHVRAAPVTSVAVAAGVVSLPARARPPQRPPPLPDSPPTGPAEPTSVEPFVITLAAALAVYGAGVAALARRQRRGRAAATTRRTRVAS